MKAHLMFADRDFDPNSEKPPHIDTLVDDLELTTLFSAMSRDDAWLGKIVPSALTRPLVDLDAILYRQRALADCLQREAVVRDIYALSTGVIETERKRFYRSGRSPSSVMFWAVELLEMLAKALRRLRAIADAHGDGFESDAFRTLFAALRAELSDEYLTIVDRHLRDLTFRDGVLLSARLGEGNQGSDYTLLEPPRNERRWFARFFDVGQDPYTLRIADRDDAGARAVAELRDRGLNLVANAVGQSCDHLLSFFDMLRIELAFYVGCLNLRARLSELELPLCFPQPVLLGRRDLRAEELYDACLALRIGDGVVRNDLLADDKDSVIITGANQGGKSTFLRAIGLSYVMMQCGMFAAARSLRASVCERLFAHYRREEDVELKSGKLDDELRRMSEIVDHLRPESVVLFNESFASTNEREGSEIAFQVVTALLEKRVRVFFVTHQYEFARMCSASRSSDFLFLRAERLHDGTRTFKIVEGDPLQTSYGIDLYRDIFGEL